MKNRGQTLTEFILVLAVLLMATSGIFIMYKKFWQSKYKKISARSGAITGVAKMSRSQAGYVK